MKRRRLHLQTLVFILIFLCACIVMTLRCGGCKREGFANSGALKKHTRECASLQTQFTQLRTTGIKRKSDTPHEADITRFGIRFKRTSRRPLSAIQVSSTL
jgi:hypothetical protein